MIKANSGKAPLSQVISSFNSVGLLSDDYRVILSTAGEPLIHPNRKDFFDAFDGFELAINSNGSIFDDDLFKLMSKKKVLLLTSVDAGTPETYAQIKGLDFFEKTKANLYRYSRAPVGIVALKYLFVPGVNDNIADIDGFIRCCDETGATFVIISVDYYSFDKISANTTEMVRRLKTGLSNLDILCVPYTAGESAEYIQALMGLLD